MSGTTASAQVARRDLVVLGGSAGCFPVLLELVASLPVDFPARLLVVRHIGSHQSVLPDLLTSHGAMPARHPDSGEVMEAGRIYVAPPDQHMLVVGERILLNRHAKENHARPAIDPLFRSAAIAQGPRVIGVLLSGRLGDGTAGLQAIKACGGMAVVQDPGDAEEPAMPASASANVAVDHLVKGADLAATLLRLAGQPVVATNSVPSTLGMENQLSLAEGNAMDLLDTIGTPSRISCPDCQGVLWQINGSRPARYRCHTGHAYTVQSLAHTHEQRSDEALWRALRSLNEREALLRDMAGTSLEHGDTLAAERLEAEAEHAKRHALQLYELVGETT